MAEPTYPAMIDTIGKLIDHGMGAFMACPTCLKAGQPDVRDIDLNRLAGHLGRNWCFIDRRWPVKCATCAAAARNPVEAARTQKPLPAVATGEGLSAPWSGRSGLAARETPHVV